MTNMRKTRKLWQIWGKLENYDKYEENSTIMIDMRKTRKLWQIWWKLENYDKYEEN